VSDWTILCDFDGTIALDDVTDTLLARFARPGWERLETDWRAGRIASRECMAGQVALLDMSPDEFDVHLRERAIDPAFGEFVAQAREHGMFFEVVSDGLDYSIHSILGREGLAGLPVTSNRLELAGDKAWRLAFPHESALCRVGSGTCKCARANEARRARRRVLLVGDGASDFCVAETADFVFAKGRLIAHCVANAIPHAAITGFADALALLPGLLEGTLGERPDSVPALASATLA
jgi:2,3-diketo-5-methylthio-1-phosphopentane phosphatase